MATTPVSIPAGKLPTPLTLRFPFWLARQFSLKRLLARTPRRSSGDCGLLLAAFAPSGPERQFVQQLLRTERRWWIYRCHQRAFCGDFVIVDMSPPPGQRRLAAVVELKTNTPLNLSGGGAGIQFRNSAAVLEHLAEQLPNRVPFHPRFVTGDGERVLQWLRRRQVRVRPKAVV